MKKIVFTGGGTAGHVTPNIALIHSLREEGWDISYIGSKNGIEKQLIENLGIPYYGISSGKLRRYFDWKNFTDPFRVLKGCFEAKKIMKELKPDICFSKGGFVTVPVVRAAAKCKVPALIHESDMTPGLANRLSMRYATKVCCNFAETLGLLGEKGVHTGTPIRKELFAGNRLEGLRAAGFTAEKPVILVVGGSTGAVRVNQAVRGILPELLTQFQVLHLCGKGKKDEAYEGMQGYVQLEYADKEMKDFFAMAELVISRAGANAICELLALKKPNILIPLSAAASRGDQILNAQSFQKQGFSFVLEEEQVTNETLLQAIREVIANRETYVAAMQANQQADAETLILELIHQYAGKSL